MLYIHVQMLIIHLIRVMKHNIAIFIIWYVIIEYNVINGVMEEVNVYQIINVNVIMISLKEIYVMNLH